MAKKSQPFTPTWLSCWDELLLKSLVIRCFLEIGIDSTAIRAELMFSQRNPRDATQDSIAVIERSLGVKFTLPLTRLSLSPTNSLEEMLRDLEDRYVDECGPEIGKILLVPSPFVGVITHASAGKSWSAIPASPLLMPFYGMVCEALMAKSKEVTPEWMLLKNRFGAFLHQQEQATIRHFLGEPLF